ncbi:MAG TPA: hypothetical protein VE959_02640 [Bryobacteraceae bacterium]|nr:hypothetical protein [Bryobacteraceae bacterium]
MNRFQSGRTIRIGLSLLFAAAGALAAADDLPKAETILDKYVEVTGGKAAYAKIHAEITTGSMEFAAMGLKGKMVEFTAEPGESYAELTMPGIGKILEGTSGGVAWASSAIQGSRVKEGDEKDETLLRARFNSDAKWREIFKSAETAGIESLDGKDCYKVVLTPNAGNPVTKWYDKQSNLLSKMAMKSKTPMGEIETETIFSDYRKEGDILLAHKAVAHAAGQEIVLTIDSVQHNAEIPKDKFELPDEIKALLKKTAK